MERKHFNLAFVLLAVMGILLLQEVWSHSQAISSIPYSEFQRLVREDKVARVTISADQIEGELKEAVNGRTRFATVRVDPDVSNELAEHGVDDVVEGLCGRD